LLKFADVCAMESFIAVTPLTPISGATKMPPVKVRLAISEAFCRSVSA
jgi:hypothetical protein